jgi:hypothetical protein
MPKRMVSGGGLGEDQHLLPGWQAAGLALAVAGTHLLVGSGAVAFAVLSTGIIWILHRLHVNAPASRSTADLIGSVLGAAPARAVGVVQASAYILVGAFSAKSVATLVLTWTPDPVAASRGWLWPVAAVAAAGVAGVVVAWLPIKALASFVTALTAFGLLVYFYIAVAVLAKVYSGTAPVEIGSPAAYSKLGVIGIVIPLALVMVGFEIPTTASDRLRSVARPLGWAMSLIALGAATTWAATNVGSSGSFRYDGSDLVYVAVEMFGGPSSMWMLAASAALGSAALIVLMWGATRVAAAALPGGTPGVLVATVITTLLAVVLCRDWGDASSKLWGVAAILLVIVYLLAAQANSRLDDSSTTAWALFALLGVVLAVAVFVTGAVDGWWPVGIAAVIAGIAAAVAASSRQSGNPNSLTTP